MRKARETKTDDAIKAALDASKAETPTLTDAQRLQLFQVLKAADDAAAQASPQATAAAIVDLISKRQQATQQTLAAANKLYASLNTQTGYQLDPQTGTFAAKPH